MIEPVFALLIGYLLGSFSGSLLLGRLFGVDVREHGSGNAGGTNALRVLGARVALLVVLIDLGKASLAVAVAWLLLPATPDWPGRRRVSGRSSGIAIRSGTDSAAARGWRAPPARAFS